MGIFDTLKRILFGPGFPPKPVPTAGPQHTPGPTTPAPAATQPSRPPFRPVQRPSEPPQRSKYLPTQDQPRLLVPDADGVLPVTIRDGFFVYVPTGQMMPPANSVLSSLGIIRFRVRGTKYHRGAKSADTSPGQPAILRREPKNEFGPNAVAVHARTPSGRLSKVGYVNKGLARGLAKRMDAGEALEARFMRGNPPGTWEEGPCVVLVDEAFRAKIRWP